MGHDSSQTFIETKIKDINIGSLVDSWDEKEDNLINKELLDILGKTYFIYWSGEQKIEDSHKSTAWSISTNENQSESIGW